MQTKDRGGEHLTALLVVMCLALALVVGATSSLAIALPDLAADLGATQTQLTWILNAYSIVFAAVLLPVGLAADRYGRRPALVIGLTVFGGASLASALADDATLVAVLRAVAGLGAAGVFPATLSVLIDAFPPERRARAVSVWAGVTGAAATLGTFIGGGMLEISGWAGIQVVFGVLALALVPGVLRFVGPSGDRTIRIDPVGGALAVVGLGALVFGVIRAGDASLSDAQALAGIVVGLVALGGFLAWELAADEPMLDVRLFRNGGLAAGSLLLTLQFFAAFGFFLLTPQYLQVVQGYSAIETALCFLPLPIGVAFVTPFVPRLMSAFGARWVGAIGMAVFAAAFVVFVLVTPDAGFWGFAVGLVLLGAGSGLALTPGTTLVVSGLPADRRTVSSAVNDLTREVGGALGGAVLGAVLIAAYQSDLAGALRGLPARVADQASAGIAGAGSAAGQLGPAGPDLLAAARDAYIGGFHVALLVGAVAGLLGAVACALLAPSGATEITDTVYADAVPAT
ncbi:MFS transporter [Solirubrobacter phytolaccae]|uniref:MFS transporter n=1 Tax=Solirubrobacter phytolaccae TaxID=1404360 RepID=A0A9X3N7H9_9ACTN|nr:MFS transporter [Solirubrobacter phytolaccae]MDA0179784.1 MFS transporter [Solirubrobacter phytolaccae]